MRKGTSSSSLVTLYPSNIDLIFSTNEVRKGWIIRQKKIDLRPKIEMFFHITLSLTQEPIEERDFPSDSAIKNLLVMQETWRSMDRGAWRATVHRVTKSWAGLSD